MSNNTTNQIASIPTTQLASVTGGLSVDDIKKKAHQGLENIKNVTKAATNGVVSFGSGVLCGTNNENGDPGLRDDRKPFQDNPLGKVKYA